MPQGWVAATVSARALGSLYPVPVPLIKLNPLISGACNSARVCVRTTAPRVRGGRDRDGGAYDGFRSIPFDVTRSINVMNVERRRPHYLNNIFYKCIAHLLNCTFCRIILLRRTRDGRSCNPLDLKTRSRTARMFRFAGRGTECVDLSNVHRVDRVTESVDYCHAICVFQPRTVVATF